MKLVLLIFFQFYCCYLFKGSKATVLIGGITNPNTRIGKEQKVALKLAIQSFSTNDSLLLLNATDLSSIDTLQGNSIAHDLIGWGANVIITTGTSQQVLVAGTTAIGAKTPIISLIPSFLISGPLSFQISYSEAAFVHCIADFVKLHSWRKIITIYEDDALGLVSNTNLLLEEALRTNGSKLEYHAVFGPQNTLSDWEKIVEAELYQMKKQYESTVYIILHSSEGLALSLFKKAKELNMTSPSYVWICGNDITDLLNSTLPPEFIANNMQGVVGIKSYINESAEYQEFFSNFENMFVSDYGKNNGNVYRPGAYAVRAYDALHAVSLAANESKMRNISLAEALSLVNFEGLSGTIMPKNSTLDNKEMKYSDYLIFGIAGGDSIRLGYWHEGFGFNPDIKNLTWFHGLIEKNATNPSGLRTLKVGIPSKPFWKNFVNVETNSTINCSAVVDPSSVTGFCIDVFTEALNFLKYNISYQFVAYTTESNSSCKVRTYNDLANLVQSQEVDLVVGDVTIIAERSRNVSFTQPFLTSELVMLILQKSTHIGWLSLKPFSRDLWICISVIIFWFIVLVWYLERNDAAADEDFRDPERWKHWAASVWLLCNSIFLKIDQGVGSYHAKLVLLLWFLLVQVLLSSFTASLSSILVAEKVSPNIDNVKVGYNAASFVHDYLLSTFNYKPENLVPINRSEDFPTAFENGIINAAYLELPYLRVYLSEHSNYATSGESRTLGGFGFVFHKQSPLRADFSTAILRLQESGKIMKLQSKHFHISLYSSPNSVKQRKEISLGLSNFTYLFIFTTGFSTLIALHKCFGRCIRLIRTN